MNNPIERGGGRKITPNVPNQFQRFIQGSFAKNKQVINAYRNEQGTPVESVVRHSTSNAVSVPDNKITPFRRIAEVGTAMATAASIAPMVGVSQVEQYIHLSQPGIVRPASQDNNEAYQRLRVTRNNAQVEKTLSLKVKNSNSISVDNQNIDKGRSIEASAVITDTYGPEVTREWLLQNPQDILAKTDIKDSNGNIIKQYVVLKKIYDSYNNRWNSVVYETHKDTSGVFTEYKALSQSPIGNMRAVATSTDGSVVLGGGEKVLRTSEDSFAISYDSGKTWKDIPWPSNFPISGGAIDIFRINDTTFLVNNANSEGGIGQVIIHINQSTQVATLQPLSLTETIMQTNFNAGSAHDLAIASVDPLTNTIEMASNGSFNLQEGINRYTINYLTGEGTVEHIATVKINGVDINLGYLYGRAIYKDSQGHTHFVSSNRGRQILYDVDMDTKTATELNYFNLLDNKVPDYINGRFFISAVDVTFDASGNKNTWVGGDRANTREWGGVSAVLMNLETGAIYDLAPEIRSSIYRQKDLQRKVINGQEGYEINIYGLGKVFLTPDGKLYFTDRGLGTALPDPLPFKVYVPVVMKAYSGGW